MAAAGRRGSVCGLPHASSAPIIPDKPGFVNDGSRPRGIPFSRQAAAHTRLLNCCLTDNLPQHDDEITYTPYDLLGSMKLYGCLYTRAGDRAVNIADATLLQRYLAGMETLDEAQLAAAELYHEKNCFKAALISRFINIANVTEIQRYAAEFISGFTDSAGCGEG